MRMMKTSVITDIARKLSSEILLNVKIYEIISLIMMTSEGVEPAIYLIPYTIHDKAHVFLSHHLFGSRGASSVYP